MLLLIKKGLKTADSKIVILDHLHSDAIFLTALLETAELLAQISPEAGLTSWDFLIAVTYLVQISLTPA